MKNFFRALRFAWPYRIRLTASILCALAVAVLWGASISSIYPFLNILGTSNGVETSKEGEARRVPGRNMQEWIDNEIAGLRKSEKSLEDIVEKYEAKAGDKPHEKIRLKQVAEIMADRATHEQDLADVRWRLSWYVFAQHYIHKWCPTDRFQTIAWVMGFVLVGVFFKGIFEFFQESLVGSVVNLSLFDMRNRLYRNVIHLDANQFTDEGTHALMARFTNDIESLGSGFKTLFGKVVLEPLKAIICIILACCISWRLTMLFLVMAPIGLFVLGKFGKYMKRASRRVLESMSSLYKILQESFQGIKVVKAFTMERYERRRFFVATKEYYRLGMRVVNLDAFSGPTIEWFGVLGIAAALLVGAYLVLEQQTHLFGVRIASEVMGTASLLTLYGLLAAVADPVRKLSSVYSKIQSGAAAADRIFDTMDRRPRVQSNTQSERLDRHHQSVEFRDVCFSYQPGIPVLSHISLEIRHGETVALVGKNGCGKSTLVGLLARFHDPDYGSIFVDGTDLRSANLRSLRQQMGLVSQETVLFDDTIYNNIAYGKRYARREEVESAARKAYAHDFIVKTSKGYQTHLREMGTGLSGGQRQRIALARAILRDPRLLILDEATSATDLESEALIQKALKEFSKDRTTILITHRLGLLENADRIVLLDNGRIEAVGTHLELLKSSATYQRLHEVQFLRNCA